MEDGGQATKTCGPHFRSSQNYHCACLSQSQSSSALQSLVTHAIPSLVRSPYGQGVWATLWVSVHFFPLSPKQIFAKIFYPEEIHHWSSDLPTKVASFIELCNISSWKTPTMITESNSCGFTLLRNQFSPRALQGICSLMPFIAACFLPVHPSDIYFGLHAVYAIGWLVELLLFPLSRNGQFPWSCKSDISNVHCSSSRLFP